VSLILVIGVSWSDIAPANAPGNFIDHGNSPALLHNALQTTLKNALGTSANTYWEFKRACTWDLIE